MYYNNDDCSNELYPSVLKLQGEKLTNKVLTRGLFVLCGSIWAHKLFYSKDAAKTFEDCKDRKSN